MKYYKIYYVARYRLYNGDNVLVYGNADEDLGEDLKEAREEYERRCEAKNKTWKSGEGYHSQYYFFEIKIHEDGKHIENYCLDCQSLD